ncbi:hypothetical protein [Biformimicrobium ophioploci]|uniref:Uncharacterized protein n=1 Tax=Biformimicrobium ophioploci TaxID=3036711 RepID=A0ABQ6LXJ7_9GAMM|nr:hypothetical protein [Microbulbifer sp. NKW57]GMG86752.1 hypothetical protein MNKW57_10730 [Microbulbifer sp. NKW57]
MQRTLSGLVFAALGGLILVASPLAGAQGMTDEQKAFYANLRQLCGATFRGESVFPKNPDDGFFGRRLEAVLSVCRDDQIQIPFHVGSDHSRTWIISVQETGLLLKHDHRKKDGSPDEITNYGGWASKDGTAFQQRFMADDFTAQLIPAAKGNVWTIQLDQDGGGLRYILHRDGKLRFEARLRRVEP